MISRPQISRWLSRHRSEVAWAAVGALVVGAILLLTRQWWDELFDALRQVDAGTLVALTFALPLVGFSILLIELVVGARFGGLTGVVIVAGAAAFHLAVTHLVARGLLRAPMEKLLRRRNYRPLRVSQESPAALALLLALIPGPPYLLRNLLLALSGIPFQTYFVVSWPIYVARSAIAIFLGDWAQDPTRSHMIILGTVVAIKLIACALAIRHLRLRHRGAAAAVGGVRAR